MLRSRRVVPQHQTAATVFSSLICFEQRRGVFSTSSSASASLLTASSSSTSMFVKSSSAPSILNNMNTNNSGMVIPMICQNHRFAASAQDLAVKEEDTESDLDGLHAFASHSFSGASVALVSIAWAEPRASTRKENPDAIATGVVFTLNSTEDIGYVGRASDQDSSSSSSASTDANGKKKKQFIQQKFFALPDKHQPKAVIETFQREVSQFLASAAKEISSDINTVVMLPSDARSFTYKRINELLTALPSEAKKMTYYFSETNVWAQVYGLYNEHRRKNRGMVMPKSLENAYEHLTDVPDFVPRGELCSNKVYDIRMAAYMSELALETFLLAVKRLCPPMKHLVKTGHFSPRELAVAQACARVVRPVHYFVMRVDNRVATSIKDRIQIRIELFNPQTKKLNRFELTSIADTAKLDAFCAEVANDVNGVTVLFTTADTTQTAQTAVLRAIRPKNPVFPVKTFNLASYMDEESVADINKFAADYEFSNNPKLMWDQMLSAVTNPSALVTAIVGAAHHRLRIARGMQSAAGSSSIPAQGYIRAKALDQYSASKNNNTNTSNGDGVARVVDSSSSFAPRSASSSRVQSERVGSQKQHQQYNRASNSQKEAKVQAALQTWSGLIYKSEERTAREEACAKKLDRFLVVDLETTTNSKYRRIANPFTGENYVVLPGALDHEGKIFMPNQYLKRNDKINLPDLSKYDVIVGHNIKFDMFYLWRLPEVQEFIRRGGMIWDTMYAEYLLSGHEIRLGQGAGLDSVAAGYGGKIKKLDEVKEAWASGKETYDISYDTLAEYLRGDLRNTEFIFKMQRTRALAQKQVNIIQHRMDSLLCTTEMEFNGLKMNVPLAKSHTDKLTAQMQELKARLDSFVPSAIPECYLREFNWASNVALMSIFFGIPLKFDPLSSAPSYRHNEIVTYGGVENLEASANLAFLSNNLQGAKLVNRLVKPYLRTRGLRTSAALEEAFDDAQIENMFETFFYGVELIENEGSSPSASSASSDSTSTDDEKVNNSALFMKDLDKQARDAANKLKDWQGKKVSKISVVHLSEKIAFEGIVDGASSSSSDSPVLPAPKKQKITLSKTTGETYELQTVTFRGKTFEQVSAAMNKWMNDVLVSTAPKNFRQLQTTGDLPRVGILFGRRNAEYYQPILKANGLSARTFKSDERIPTKIAFGDDCVLETCALRYLTSEVVIPKIYSSSSALGKAPKTQPQKKGGKKTAAVVEEPAGPPAHRQIRPTSKTPELAADLLEREEIDGRFSDGNSSLYRAVMFGDRAYRLSKLIVGDYYRKKKAFLDERKKNGPSPKDKQIKLQKKISEKTVPLEHRLFKMPGIPQTCFLDAPFASSPSVSRAQQLIFLRCVGSQLKDDDAFAFRLDEAPPLEIELEGKLQQYVKTDTERRELLNKFTSPDTKKLLVGEETLSYFAKTHKDELSKVLLENRAIEKQLSTYYEDKKSGMMALVHSNDSCIHHELVHNKTTTGRLSSANPNCQNIPKEDKSPIRELFVSRFGDDGVCIEADYSQLEVVTLCCLSKDMQMTKDLEAKVDFHCKRVAMMRPEYTYEEILQRAKKNKEPEFVKMRSQAKIFSFQRQYGAGVKMLSESTGLSPEVIKQIIQKEREEYSGTDTFYDMVSLSCHTFDPNLQTGQRNKHGDPIYKGMFPVLTGSRYVFTQSDVPFDVMPGEPTTNYSPTHLKNYPVQGFAGEIVQIMLGQLYRHFVKTKNYDGKALLTNTVHDCVWIDARREVAELVADDCARIMSNAREVLNKNWPEIECAVEFPVDVVVGPNMGHMVGLKGFDWTGKNKQKQ